MGCPDPSGGGNTVGLDVICGKDDESQRRLKAKMVLYKVVVEFLYKMR